MQTLKIKQLAERLNVSPHTLRFYDDEGLFPDITRDEHGTRIFSEESLEWVHLVLCLRSTGMSVADIKNYVRLCAEGDCTVMERYQIILKQKRKAEEEMREMERRLRLLAKKEQHYLDMIECNGSDACNPAAKARA